MFSNDRRSGTRFITDSRARTATVFTTIRSKSRPLRTSSPGKKINRTRDYLHVVSGRQVTGPLHSSFPTDVPRNTVRTPGYGRIFYTNVSQTGRILRPTRTETPYRSKYTHKLCFPPRMISTPDRPQVFPPPPPPPPPLLIINHGQTGRKPALQHTR